MAFFILVFGLVLVLGLLALSDVGTRQSRPTYPIMQTGKDNSFVYYRDEDGTLQCLEEACAGCVENEAASLASKGYQVERVELGRLHSGDLVL